MIKSTTKEFKNQVQQHIISNLGMCYDKQTNKEYPGTLPEKLQNVVNEFNNYYNNPCRAKTNKSTAFGDFLLCLPSCLSINYTCYGERMLLKEWFKQTEAESNKYSDTLVCKTYLSLIYREFCTLCKQNNIEF